MVPVRSPHPEWSPARGLSRAALWLLIKSPFCLILWAAFLVITEPAATWIATHAGTFWILPGTAILATAVAAIPALPCGHLLARRLTEQVGFEGPVPAGLGIMYEEMGAYGSGRQNRAAKRRDPAMTETKRGILAACDPQPPRHSSTNLSLDHSTFIAQSPDLCNAPARREEGESVGKAGHRCGGSASVARSPGFLSELLTTESARIMSRAQPLDLTN